MSNIEPTSKVVVNILKQIIFLPITLVQVVFGKKPFSELFAPLRTAWRFLLQAKGTLTLIVIILLTTLAGWYLGFVETWIQFPQDLFTERWWSFFTATLIHADIAHIVGNLMLLFVMGRIVERELGTRQLILLYLAAIVVSGIGTSIIYQYVIPSTTGGLGASGAIMGITAVALLLKPFQLTFEFIIPLPLAVVGAFLIYADITNLFVNDGVGHLTHLAGFFLTGMLAYVTNRSKQKDMHKGVVVTLLLSVAMYLLGIYEAVMV